MERFVFFLHRNCMKLRDVCYYLLKKSTLGVRAIVLNEHNQILLVKHTYQPGWYLPGGGVERGEAFATAIIRELQEEAGVIVAQEPELFGIYLNLSRGVSDYPVLYIVKEYSLVPSNSPEIKEKGWFDYSQLPKDTTPATMARLKEYFQHLPADLNW